jgi:hypothetical protein
MGQTKTKIKENAGFADVGLPGPDEPEPTQEEARAWLDSPEYRASIEAAVDSCAPLDDADAKTRRAYDRDYRRDQRRRYAEQLGCRPSEIRPMTHAQILRARRKAALPAPVDVRARRVAPRPIVRAGRSPRRARRAHARRTVRVDSDDGPPPPEPPSSPFSEGGAS